MYYYILDSLWPRTPEHDIALKSRKEAVAGHGQAVHWLNHFVDGCFP